jgi:HK97 family phage portal protein
MDFIDSKHSSARDIALAFGVPPQLLGIPGDNTYGNLVEARQALWEQTILPLVDNVTNSLNSWLIPNFGGNLELTYNTDEVPALAAKREKKWKQIDEASFMTVNEKREALGLESVIGGDKILN